MRTILTSTLALLALLTALLAGVPAALAQTIVNTATAQWGDQVYTFNKQSNTVTHTVQAQPAHLALFRLSPSATGERLTFAPSLCGDVPVEIPGAGGQFVTTGPLEETTQVRKGEVVYLRIAEPLLNRDNVKIDTISAVVTSASGDSETITVFETAPNSGLFIGAIPTAAIPPVPVVGDCKVSTRTGDQVKISIRGPDGNEALVSNAVEVLADPFGFVFDTETGQPIDGVTVTLIDTATGAPAKVFADDGVTAWPATVVTGQTIIDGASRPHPLQSGQFRFPLVRFGTYRFEVSAPAPLQAPSKASEAMLAGLLAPDGEAFVIKPGSFGKDFAVNSVEALRIDIPVDLPPAALMVNKSTSRTNVLPGDVVVYSVTVTNPDRVRKVLGATLIDTPSANLRFRPDTVRIDGQKPSGNVVEFAPDGSTMKIQLGDIAGGKARKVIYAMSVRPNANAGEGTNTVEVIGRNSSLARAGAAVRIEREDLASRAVFMGRIVAGGCTVAGKGAGIPGVRVVMEDGSFAVSDADGRYHFQGVTPGNHVLHVVPSTLPLGARFVDCAKSTRSTGSAISRFVTGQGGNVAVADFYAVVPEDALAAGAAATNAPVSGASGTAAPAKATTPVKAEAAPVGTGAAAAVANSAARAAMTDEERRAVDDADSRRAAGADTDWMAFGAGPTEFLFPAADHNPRAPAVRVVIRHRQNEKIELLSEGKPVDKVALDSVTNSKDGLYTISIWRGVPLKGEDTRLTAVVRDANGTVVNTLTRDVHFSNVAARVEFLPAQSNLIADGTTRPVIALRLLDRKGRPVHSGLTGDFTLSSPYESAEALEARQTRSLTGMNQLAPRWFVRGDDGIAYVELAPTMVSGKLRMEFQFTDGQQRRRQDLETWVEPGNQPWTVVGLAEAGAGSRDIADSMQRTKPFDSDLGDNARIALYVKGQISKGLLVTGTYDSAKQRDEQRLMGNMDARAYYTVFADNSDRRYDAASREKLYLRLEGKGFSGFYGDFQAGFDQTQLARYQRAATGVRAEATSGRIQAAAFAARVASTHQRDEIQGAGITGPYRLSSRAIIPGSESVQLEVRDRFRSEVIVTRKQLSRFADYEIDRLSGTITFREPILSRDDALNPQFVVIDYELDETARGGEVNAGVRTAYSTRDGKVRIGATGLTDTSANGGTRTDLAAVDARVKLGTTTEVRAEAARSFNAQDNANAWLVEAEHHTGNLDVLAYARSADLRFGVGQMSGAERGRRKLGLDTRYRISEDLSLTASAWNDTSLNKGGQRNAVQVGAVYRSQRTDARIGFSTMQDTLSNGTREGTTTLDLSAAQRMFNNKLEIAAATSLALTKAKAVDLPNRHRLNLRYAITNNIRLTGSYEIARGEKTNTRTARGGVEVSPWNGARISTAIGKESSSADSKRAFASMGVSQSLQVTPRLAIDASVESVRTLSNLYARRFNADHPNSSGGALGDGQSLSDDFTAVSLGGNWRGGRWVLNGRAEWRNGKLEDRRGIQFSVIRQMGEGSMLGGNFSYGHVRTARGSTSRTFNSALALAYRPSQSTVALLAKLEVRSDAVTDAKAGEQITGNALTVSGDAMSTRVIGSVAMDWSPYAEEDGYFFQRSELSLFGAVRTNFDTVDSLTIAGTTLISGVDARLGLGEHFEIGGRATVRASLSDGTTHYSSGPEIGVSPTRDVLLTFGYNVTGYYDRDFTAAKYTNDGPYAGIRLKFDASSFPLFGSF